MAVYSPTTNLRRVQRLLERLRPEPRLAQRFTAEGRRRGTRRLGAYELLTQLLIGELVAAHLGLDVSTIKCYFRYHDRLLLRFEPGMFCISLYKQGLNPYIGC